MFNHCITRVIISMMFVIIQSEALAEKKNTNIPEMKVVDRDWQYFVKTPCAQLSKITVHSDNEKKMLDKRKQQCIKQYEAFFPGAGPKK